MLSQLQNGQADLPHVVLQDDAECPRDLDSRQQHRNSTPRLHTSNSTRSSLLRLFHVNSSFLSQNRQPPRPHHCKTAAVGSAHRQIALPMPKAQRFTA
jgi:hypothetical protein